jgi:hypothetical protein
MCLTIASGIVLIWGKEVEKKLNKWNWLWWNTG